MRPPRGSKKRQSRFTMVLLPPPVGPTRAIVSPCFTSRLKSLQDRLALLVVELHVVEDDVAPERAVVRRARLVHHIRHRVHEREDALARGDGLLHLGEDARHLLHRPDDEDDVGDEGVEAAYRQPAHVHGDAGVGDHAGGGQGRDQLHGGQEERREPRGPIAGPVHLARQLAELAAGWPLPDPAP